MKKLLSLLSVLTIMGTSLPTVTAASNYEKQNVRFKRQNDFKILYNKIKNWDLGELPDNLPETILKRLYKLNKNIKKNSLRILNVQQNTARIIWDNDVDSTSNFIDIFFTVDYIENNDRLVGNSCFYDAIILKPHRPAPRVPTEIEEPIYATVLSKSQRNKQNNVKPAKSPRDLNILLSITDLGELPDNLPETILERVILLNTNIDLDEVVIHDITHDLARISSNPNSTRYYGTVIVHFTLNNKEVKTIKEDKNKQDPNDDKNDSVNKLINKFNKLCSNNEINNLNRIKVLNKNTKGGNLKDATYIIGTNNGVYLKHGNGKIDKFNGLNFPIIDIELDGKGSAYVLNNTGKIYHLDLYGWGYQQIPKITKNLNLNWDITGPITNDKKTESTQINLIKWSDYANSIEEFKEKYKHIKFNNLSAQAGGQGTTISNNTNIEFNTENIDGQQNNKEIIKYHFLNFIPALFVNYIEQSANLYIKNLFFEGEYLKASIISNTYSWMAVYHVWTKLKIDSVEFY